MTIHSRTGTESNRLQPKRKAITKPLNANCEPVDSEQEPITGPSTSHTYSVAILQVRLLAVAHI